MSGKNDVQYPDQLANLFLRFIKGNGDVFSIIFQIDLQRVSPDLTAFDAAMTSQVVIATLKISRPMPELEIVLE
jgi:hypothetical protein